MKIGLENVGAKKQIKGAKWRSGGAREAAEVLAVGRTGKTEYRADIENIVGVKN